MNSKIERTLPKMTKEEAREFASRWLPAWTGNEPEKLADYYSEAFAPFTCKMAAN